MNIFRRRDLLFVVLSLNAAACSDKPTVAATAPVLCDGSDQARLTYVVSGGFVESRFSFYGAYGHSFFSVDGMCRFWAGGEPLAGVRTGTLTTEQAGRIARETHFAEIPTLSAHRDSEGCPDATYAQLGALGKAIMCTCGCDQRPEPISDAFFNVHQIHADLMTWGATYDGPLRAAAVDANDVPKWMPPPGKTVDWTLPWSPATIVFGDQVTADSGKAIDTAEDRLGLRQMRAAAAVLMTSPHIYARMPDGQFFVVYTRDEPPAMVSQAISGLYLR